MDAGKYTAQEIVEIAGFKDVQFGDIRVRISGIRGIVSATHVINVLPGDVEVTVGGETRTLKVVEGEGISEGARAALDAEGREATKQVEALQARKAESKEE